MRKNGKKMAEIKSIEIDTENIEIIEIGELKMLEVNIEYFDIEMEELECKLTEVVVCLDLIIVDLKVFVSFYKN